MRIDSDPRAPRSGVRSAAARRLCTLAAALLAAACAEPAREPRPSREPPPRAREAPAGGFAFVNRVWVVEASNAVPPGAVYVFLADRTLVLAAPGSTPAFGRWEFERGELRIVEAGVSRSVEIREAKGDRLHLIVGGAGESVSLELRDARPDWIDR